MHSTPRSMNGYHNSVPRFQHDDDPISPHSLDSPPWGSMSGISSSLDQRVLSERAQPQASQRSAALFQQMPSEVIERYVRVTVIALKLRLEYIRQTGANSNAGSYGQLTLMASHRFAY